MNEYEDEWTKDEPAKDAPAAEAKDEMPAPATSAVRSAYDQARDEDAKAFSDAFNAPDAPQESKLAPMAEPVAAPKPVKFGDAFKTARAEGKTVFDFEGKKYTTDLAKAKAAVKAPEAAPEVKAQAKPEAKAPAKEPMVNGKDAKSIYNDDTFPKNAIRAIQAKMSNDGQAEKPKLLASGKPNLTAQ